MRREAKVCVAGGWKKSEGVCLHVSPKQNKFAPESWRRRGRARNFESERRKWTMMKKRLRWWLRKVWPEIQRLTRDVVDLRDLSLNKKLRSVSVRARSSFRVLECQAICRSYLVGSSRS